MPAEARCKARAVCHIKNTSISLKRARVREALEFSFPLLYAVVFARPPIFVDDCINNGVERDGGLFSWVLLGRVMYMYIYYLLAEPSVPSEAVCLAPCGVLCR